MVTNLYSRVVNYFLSASGTSIPAVGYILVAGITAGSDPNVSLFLIVLSYISATCSLLGHVTGPIFLQNSDFSRDVQQIIFSTILVLIFSISIFSIYNFFQKFIPFEYLIAVFLVVFSQLISPFWYVDDERKFARIFSVLSIVRVAAFVFIMCLARLQLFNYSHGALIFSLISVVSAISLGGGSELFKIIKQYPQIKQSFASYFREIKSLVISQQMNLFVSYLMPIITLNFIDPESLPIFFIFERIRYILLSICNSFYIYWQRNFVEMSLGEDYLVKWYRFSIYISAFSGAVALIIIFVFWRYSILTKSDFFLGVWIIAAACLGVMGSYLTNVVFVVRRDYRSIFDANAGSLALYVMLSFPLVMTYGVLGLAVATVVLELTILLQLRYKIAYFD